MTPLRLLASLPISTWLRGVALVLAFAAVAVFGFAILAGAVVVVAVLAILFKARAWLAGLFAATPGATSRPQPAPAQIQRAPVSDADFVVIERR